jgi:hypothetical protein
MAVATALLLPTDHPIHRVQRVALGLSGLGLVGCIAFGLADVDAFLQAWLVAWYYCVGTALGCLGVLMLTHVTGGAWGASIRRVLEAGARTLPLLAVAFLPIVFGMPHVYEWANPDLVRHDELLQWKAPYLNVPFFLARAVIYFALWIGLTRLLTSWSLEQDRTGDRRLLTKLEYLSRGGIVALVATMTFASFDWTMSLQPPWYSSIYGAIFVAASGISAFAIAIVATALLVSAPPVRGVVGLDQLHDLGKLQLGFVMIWAYFSLSQGLIIFAANLPEEITWYLARTNGGWQYLFEALALFQFCVPFLLLLSRPLKRNPNRLAGVALLLLAVRYVDSFWVIMPAFQTAGHARFVVHPVDLAALLAVGGAWVWFFVRNLEGRSLVPLRDPSLPVVP